MGGTHYRDDITGLRAVAVLAVIAYHFGGEWLPGGYLGVDIFFVISGYVITRMIRKEVATTGRFRFGHFYLRRVRRLLPSLLTTIALAFIGAALVFSPQYLEQFSVSAF